MYSKHVVEQIFSLISKSKMLSIIPVKINGCIRVGGYEIMPIEQGYYIINVAEDKVIAETWTKAAALAYVRVNITQRQEHIPTIKQLDQTIEKHELDSRFYKHSLDHVSDEQKHLSITTRLELSEAISAHAKQQIKDIILE
jgi:hypothetical protein